MRFRTPFLVVLTLSVAAASAARAGNAQIVGYVSRVVDGDTLWIGRTKIRLAGIEAPALSTTDGAASRLALASIVTGQVLSCADTGGRTYGRVAAICRDQAGRDLGALMVAGGWAWDWHRYSGGRYLAAEWGARLNRRGLFAANPLRPRQEPERRAGAAR